MNYANLYIKSYFVYNSNKKKIIPFNISIIWQKIATLKLISYVCFINFLPRLQFQ